MELRRPPGPSVVMAVLTIAGLCAALSAKDPLTMIPADAPGVIVLPNLAATTAKVNALARRISPDGEAYRVDDFGEDINLAAGGWDASAPVVLILTRPEFDKSSLLVAFTPRSTENLIVKVGLKDEMPGRCDGPIGPCWITVRDGVAFAAQKRSAFRVLKDIEPGGTFADVLDSTERRMLAEDDVFVRLDVTRWRERITPPLSAVLQIMMWGIAAETDPENLEASQAVLGWFTEGIQAFVEQTYAVAASGRVDEKSLRFTHHHRFAAGKSISAYLNSVKNERHDLLASLPDRPFWLAAVANWRCPSDQSFSVRITERLMKLEPIGGEMETATRDRLLADIRSCYGQIKGSAFMISSPAGSIFPMEMLGSYLMDDAAKGLAQFCFIQEHLNEAAAVFMPGGGGMKSRFVNREEKGVKFSEMPIKLEELPEKARIEIEMVYGTKARYQIMALDRHELFFTLSQPPMSVIELARLRKAGPRATLAANKNVQRTVRLLPDQPNALILVDAQQLIAAVPQLARQSAEAHGGAVADMKWDAIEAKPTSQALFGWACEVGTDTLTGQLAVTTDDFVDTVDTARSIVAVLKETAASAKPSPED